MKDNQYTSQYTYITTSQEPIFFLCVLDCHEYNMDWVNLFNLGQVIEYYGCHPKDIIREEQYNNSNNKFSMNFIQQEYILCVVFSELYCVLLDCGVICMCDFI